MKITITILFFLLAQIIFGQAKFVAQQYNFVGAYHQALVNKDIIKVDELTHKNLSYGHSNGWVETKKEQIKNIETNFLIYKGIKTDSIKITQLKKTALVRFTGDFQFSLQGKDAEIKLSVLEVWNKIKGKWKLIARQSTKI